MSHTNKLPSEQVAVVGTIAPSSAAAGTTFSEYIPLKNFGRFQAIIQAGVLGASATVDAKLVAYTSAAGATPTDITGAAIVQLTQASTDSGKSAVINLNTDALAGTPLFTHFRLSLTVAAAASLVSAIVLGFDSKSSPASAYNSTLVDSIVSAN